MQRTTWWLGLVAVFAAAGCSSGMQPGSDASDITVLDASDAAQPPADGAADVEAAPPDVCDGRRRTFWAWDLTIMPPPDIQVDTGCRLETAHGALYSTDDVWPSPLSPAVADAVMTAWESATPADPNRGIYAIDTATFGDPPDVDNDPHVILFYRNIGTFHGFVFDGFFRATDESTDDPVSNGAEMLHLNVGHRIPSSTYMLGVVAHEFVHLIAWQYGDEDVWLSETLGEAGMLVTGYLGDVTLAMNFVQLPTSPLVTNAAGADYGPFFLFADYLIERYGAAILGEIARDPARGIPTVETALSHHGGGTFRQVFGEWAVANLLDAGHPPYGYAAFHVSTESAATMLTGGMATPASVVGWTVGYFLLDLPSGATTADVTVASPSFANLEVHTALYDPAARPMATVAAFPLSSATATSSIARGTAGSRLVVIIANAATAAANVTVTVTPH